MSYGGKLKLLVVLICALFLASCSQAVPATLTPTDEFIDVTIVATRSDFVRTHLPKSEYSRKFNFDLGEEFLNLDDPTWWERYHTELEKVYLDERSDNPTYFRSEINVYWGDSVEPTPESPYWIYEVPPVEWLRTNVRRGIEEPFLEAQIYLPSDGTLRKVVDNESYQNYIENYPREKKELKLMQVVIGDTEVHSLWEVYSFLVDRERKQYNFFDSLEDLQDTDYGTLLYMFADGKRYVYLQFPEEFLNLTADDLLGHDYTTTLRLEIFSK